MVVFFIFLLKLVCLSNESPCKLFNIYCNLKLSLYVKLVYLSNKTSVIKPLSQLAHEHFCRYAIILTMFMNHIYFFDRTNILLLLLMRQKLVSIDDTSIHMCCICFRICFSNS